MGRVDLDRQGMSALLGPYLAGGAATTKEDRTLIAGAGTIKTYTVEAETTVAAPDMLARAVSGLGVQPQPTSDPDLWLVRAERLTLFVDLLDPRFWLVHTASSAGRARQTMRRWLWDAPQFDSCWFPQSFLRDVHGDASPRWFKADFRGDGYLPSAGVSDRRLKVQLEGEGADGLFEALRSDERYRSATALSALGFSIGDGSSDAVEEVTRFDGSFVARGRSFESHVGYVAQVIDRYRQLVERIESDHRMHWTAAEQGGFRFDGDVATITLGRPIRDLDQLLDGLFSCRDPFRLWAVPHKETDDFATAEVVDLHIGEAFSMDIGPDYIRVYLSERACGNTILRLLTNLQRHYDATATLRCRDGRSSSTITSSQGVAVN